MKFLRYLRDHIIPFSLSFRFSFPLIAFREVQEVVAGHWFYTNKIVPRLSTSSSSHSAINLTDGPLILSRILEEVSF